MVGFEASDEPVQLREVIRSDRGDPRVEVFAAAFSEHLRECGDVGGGGLEMSAAGEDLLESDLLLDSEVVGAAQHPGRDPSDLRHRPADRGSPGLTQQPDVVADGGVAARSSS